MKIKLLLIIFILLLFSSIGIVSAAGGNGIASGGCDDSEELYNPGEYKTGKIDTTITSVHGEYNVTIYYPATEEGYSQPVDRSGAPYPMILFGHGMMASKDYYTWMGDYLSTWGYLTTLISTPSIIDLDELFNSDTGRGESIEGFILAYEYLSDLNSDATSPLYGMIDTEAVGISGHSLGAYSGTLLLDENAIPLKAAVLFAPPNIEEGITIGGINIKGPSYASVDWENITAAVQYQVGSNDGMVPTEGVWELYDLLPGKKEMIEVNGANHSGYMDPGLETYFANLLDDEATITMQEHHRIISDYMLAWFEYYLRGDMSYNDQLFGSIIENEKVSGAILDYEYEK